MIKQRYEAYRAECARTDADSHGAVLRVHTEQEQELYDAWQTAIKECTTWRDGDTTWRVLSKYQDSDLEMWHCRIEEQGKPATIADCYASYIREMAQPIEDEQITVSQ